MDRRSVSYKGPLGRSRRQRRLQKKIGNKKIKLFGNALARFMAIMKNRRSKRGNRMGGRGGGKGKRGGRRKGGRGFGGGGGGSRKRGYGGGGGGRQGRMGGKRMRYGLVYSGSKGRGSFRRRRRGAPTRSQLYPKQTFSIDARLSVGTEVRLVPYPQDFDEGQSAFLTNPVIHIPNARFSSESNDGYYLCLCRMGRSDLPVNSTDDRRILYRILIRPGPQGNLQSVTDQGFVKEGIHIVYPFAIRLKNPRNRVSLFIVPTFSPSGFRIRTPLTVDPSIMIRRKLPPPPPLIDPSPQISTTIEATEKDFDLPERYVEENAPRLLGGITGSGSEDVHLMGTITYGTLVKYYAFSS